jgi:hypothetical protein
MNRHGAAPRGSARGHGFIIEGNGSIIHVQPKRRACSVCRTNISSAPGHHILCPKCFRGMQFYRALRSFIQER